MKAWLNVQAALPTKLQEPLVLQQFEEKEKQTHTHTHTLISSILPSCFLLNTFLNIICNYKSKQR